MEERKKECAEKEEQEMREAISGEKEEEKHSIDLHVHVISQPKH